MAPITVEPKLLNRADAHAGRIGQTRAWVDSIADAGGTGEAVKRCVAWATSPCLICDTRITDCGYAPHLVTTVDAIVRRAAFLEVCNPCPSFSPTRLRTGAMIERRDGGIVTRLQRLIDICRRLTPPGCGTVDGLAKTYNVNRKSIQRDLAEIRQTLGLPIDDDGSGILTVRPNPAGPTGGLDPAGDLDEAVGRLIEVTPTGQPDRTIVKLFVPPAAPKACHAEVAEWFSRAHHVAPDGGLTVLCTVSDTARVARLVLSWGGAITVLSPPALRADVARLARRLLNGHPPFE